MKRGIMRTVPPVFLGGSEELLSEKTKDIFLFTGKIQISEQKIKGGLRGYAPVAQLDRATAF